MEEGSGEFPGLGKRDDLCDELGDSAIESREALKLEVDADGVAEGVDWALDEGWLPSMVETFRA